MPGFSIKFSQKENSYLHDYCLFCFFFFICLYLCLSGSHLEIARVKEVDNGMLNIFIVKKFKRICYYHELHFGIKNIKQDTFTENIIRRRLHTYIDIMLEKRT